MSKPHQSEVKSVVGEIVNGAFGLALRLADVLAIRLGMGPRIA